MVSITLFGSILRIKEKTASLISASISCSLEAPALMTAARTCKILEVTMQGLWMEYKKLCNENFSAIAAEVFNRKYFYL